MKISGLVLILAFLSLGGCSSLIFPSSSPPVYYQLNTGPSTVHCPNAFHKSIRLWKFGAASPYDRREMIVVQDGREVSISSAFQWVAPPAAMLGDMLYRDLSMGGIFPQVVTANDPVDVPLDMTGRILVFAWEREGETSRAVLEFEVSVTGMDGGSGALFHKSYSLKSEPVKGEGSSEEFAQAMSRLAEEGSERLRRDLCQFVGKQRSAEASGGKGR
jgi:ABC-type uncharacterized transport system auxiliary subunit